VQRIGLAERIGVEPVEIGGDDHPPSHLEAELIRIWESALGFTGVGVNDDFFALGGDSILGAEAVARVRDVIDDPNLPLVSIVRAPTPAAMAREAFSGLGIGASGVVPLQESGSRSPLFLVHAGDGDVLTFAVLARRLGPEQPSYGLRVPGLDDGTTIPSSFVELATDYVADIRRVQPDGPYVLGGYCLGAGIAVEMARQLEAAGEEVAMLVLLDPRFAARGSLRTRMWIARRKARTALRSVRDRELLEALGRQIHPTRSDSPVPGRLSRLRDAHTTRPFDFPAALVFSEEVMEEWAKGWYPPWFFESVVRNPSRWKVIPSLHERLLLPPAVDDVAAEIRAALDQAAGSRAAA
jgi:thioesterase domain-containing protein